MVCLPHAGQSPGDGGTCCRLSLRLTVACLFEQHLQVFLRPAPVVEKSGKSSNGLTSPHSLHGLEAVIVVVGVNYLV